MVQSKGAFIFTCRFMKVGTYFQKIYTDVDLRLDEELANLKVTLHQLSPNRCKVKSSHVPYSKLNNL